VSDTGELAQRAALSLQQDADIARRSLAGIWAGLGLVQFALLAGTYSNGFTAAGDALRRHHHGAYLVRLFLVLRKNQIYPRNPAPGERLLRNAAVLFERLGIVELLQLHLERFFPLEFAAADILRSGISFGAIVSLTPGRLYLYCHVLPLLVPPIVVDLALVARGYGMAVINLVCLAFLLAQGRQLSAQYRKAI
jgi:hypothetical protein